MVKPPKIIPNAATTNDKIPMRTLPFVSLIINGVLKKIPDPITIPTIIAIVVIKPNFRFGVTGVFDVI
ncbi:hypothetical protein SDC9_199586 [bioreactor metagenome]|uniref:Uncharacterized protein n=1 Tax=bioreactor metagenome TaxID=1076179 RepID=A0A645IKU4_9ZZZZ